MKLTFGKYKGRLVSEILSEDLAYIGWCVEKQINLNLSKQQMQDAEYELQRERATEEAIFESEHSDWGDRD